jgi:hypothetical protein
MTPEEIAVSCTSEAMWGFLGGGLVGGGCGLLFGLGAAWAEIRLLRGQLQLYGFKLSTKGEEENG